MRFEWILQLHQPTILQLSQLLVENIYFQMIKIESAVHPAVGADQWTAINQFRKKTLQVHRIVDIGS